VIPHRYAVRVYFEDTDAGGIVYHANYLRFAERARTEAMREAGVPHSRLVAEHGLLFVVRRVKMDYLRPAGLDDLITVETTPVAMRGVTVQLRQGFVVDGVETAVMEILLACVRREDSRPARIPPLWRAALSVPGEDA
jgi:acyl-CoA thioester hydrolase